MRSNLFRFQFLEIRRPLKYVFKKTSCLVTLLNFFHCEQKLLILRYTALAFLRLYPWSKFLFIPCLELGISLLQTSLHILWDIPDTSFYFMLNLELEIPGILYVCYVVFLVHVLTSHKVCNFIYQAVHAPVRMAY